MRDLKHVAFAADEVYAKPLTTAVFSLCKSNQDGIVIHILHTDLSLASQRNLITIAKRYGNEITFHLVEDVRLGTLKTNIEYISTATYYRYLLPELLPDVAKLLYLDADIMVLRDLSDLFATPLTNAYAAGVHDRCVSKRDDGQYLSKIGFGHLKSHYINAGVLLLNLEHIRKDSLIQSFFDNDQKLREICYFQDQDVLNVSFNTQVKLVDMMFNWMTYERDRRRLFSRFKNPYIVHFTGPVKPWHEGVLGYWNEKYKELSKECNELLKDE